MAMFSNAKVGDRVYCWYFGWGVIISTNDIECGRDYPISVEFTKEHDKVWQSNFSLDGFNNIEEVNPTLFWDEPQFEIPQKPFNLKEEYKKLKRKEFVSGEENCRIALYWGEEGPEWDWTCDRKVQTIGTYYYEKDSLEDFVKILREYKATFEQLEQVIKGVENED